MRLAGTRVTSQCIPVHVCIRVSFACTLPKEGNIENYIFQAA